MRKWSQATEKSWRRRRLSVNGQGSGGNGKQGNTGSKATQEDQEATQRGEALSKAALRDPNSGRYHPTREYIQVHPLDSLARARLGALASLFKAQGYLLH